MNPITVDREIALVPYYPNCKTALAWYQDPELCRQVDNRDTVYDLPLLRKMYGYLRAHGDLFYIKYRGRLCGDVCLLTDGEIAIVVAKPWQNLGIGRRVIGAIVALAREKGYPSCWAKIYDFNTQSQHTFSRAGFVRAPDGLWRLPVVQSGTTQREKRGKTMNITKIRQILKDTDFIHTGGSDEELRVAEYLKARCEELGVPAALESFAVEMADVHSAALTCDGRQIPCKGYKCCGSGTVEAPVYYMPNTDPGSLAGVAGKIVLLDTGVSHFLYQDMVKNGAVGFITYDGNVHYRDRDIDHKELRQYVSLGKKILGVNINAKDAFALVSGGVKTARITVEQTEYQGQSRNVVAQIPGRTEEWIVLSAHYDTTPLSHGAYDNMSGCIGLLNILEALAKKAPHRYGLRFVFCGSEERGLLGSKAYVQAHEAELEQVALNINLDMIGTVMGKFIACVSGEEALVSYLRYLSAETGWGLAARQGVYSSDSTPFADKGVPALSFARIAGANQATIHNRYDTMALLSPEQLRRDSAFIAEFTRRMADAAVCPVKREIPEAVKKELDIYLNRKRKENG